MIDAAYIREHRPQNQLHYFPVIGSTMTEAARLASAGAPHGTVVLADEQTAGIGRLGRHWISDREDGIYCSILLRLPISPADLPVVTLALGLATAEAIEQTSGLPCDLRWPNDVLIKERKVAGILAQLQERCVVAGIGINVNQTALPENLRTPAASLRMITGRPLQREPLVVSLLARVEEFAVLLVEQGPETIIKSFTAASSYVLHRRVVYETDHEARKGFTLGLDNNGFLQVRDEAGRIQTLYTGSVRPDVS